MPKRCGPNRAFHPAEATSASEIEIMPARSKKQQMAAGAALAAKRGKRPKSSLKGASKQMEKSMSENQLKDFAKTKRKKAPSKKRSMNIGWVKQMKGFPEPTPED